MTFHIDMELWLYYTLSQNMPGVFYGFLWPSPASSMQQLTGPTHTDSSLLYWSLHPLINLLYHEALGTAPNVEMVPSSSMKSNLCRGTSRSRNHYEYTKNDYKQSRGYIKECIFVGEVSIYHYIEAEWSLYCCRCWLCWNWNSHNIS